MNLKNFRGILLILGDFEKKITFFQNKLDKGLQDC